tara:strand:+ start:4741 stop:6141 length:1401 start_codon:yes stop_codon:yes gene_type:complete
MKKNIQFKGVFLALFVISVPSNILAQSNADDPEMAAQKAKFEQQKNSGVMEVSGGACQKYVNKKNWKNGENFKKNGDSFFVAVGTSEVKAPINSSSYASSTMNGAILAGLDSKRALVESMGTQITSDILSTSIQQFSEGTKPDFLEISEKPVKEIENYEDLSIFQKTTMLVNQQLDKLIDPETKEAIAAKELSSQELEEKLKDVLNQSTFKNSIKSNASGSIRGMKSIFVNFSVNKNQKQTIICSVGLWSENLANQVDAMTTGNYKALQNKKPGKPLMDYVPDEKTFEGYLDILGTFGTFIVRNERGEVSVLSYAQEGIKTSSAQSERIAFDNAKLRARNEIIRLRDEHIDIVSSMQKQETTTENADGMVDYWSEENSKSRISASANGTLKGDYELKRWKANHTLNDRPVAGVVIAWSPSESQFMDKASNTLSKAPKSAAGSSVTLIESESSAAGGSSAGDDEDDF